MSDFYKARLSALYTPEGQEELPLIRHNHLLAEPPTLEWSLQTASYEYIAHQWAGDLPTGNARLTLTAQPLIRANTRASLERKLRHLELTLNLNRTGTLLLEEAYTQGAPTLHTWWTAVIETANAAPLPLDQAPPIPGAWGKLDLSIILTNPSDTPPNPNPNPNPNPENPDNPGTQDDPGMPEPTWTPTDNFTVWTLDITDMYAAPWSTDANFFRDALRSLGLTHVVENGTTHTDLQEDWTQWQAPDNDARQSYPLTAYFPSHGVSSSEILGAIAAQGVSYLPAPTCTPGIPTHAAGWLLSLDMGEAFLINGVEIPPPQDYHRLDPGVWDTVLQHANLPLSAIGLHIGNGTPAPVHVYLMANQPGTAGEQITLQADGAGGQVSAPTLLLPTPS